MDKICNVKFIFGGLRSHEVYDLTIDNGIVADVEPKFDYDGKVNYVTGNFIDIHTHGAVGHDVSELTPQALSAIGKYLLDNGIAAYCPTFVATPLDVLDGYMDKLRTLKSKTEGAEILGAHIEGPYISIAKKGAQPVENIKMVYDEANGAFFDKNKDVLKIVTLCPATENADKLVAKLTACGIKSEAGHDDSYDFQIESCMKNGLDGATHIYCASSGFRKIKGDFTKYLGLNETALLNGSIYCEVIADNIHISENLFKFIWKNKTFAKTILVSDSLSPTGAPDGEYLLGGTVPIVTDGKAAYLKDKSALAGSVTNVAKMIENLVSYGIPIAEAVYSVTEAPAKYLGIAESIGVEIGSAASFNLLDDTGKLLSVYYKGKKIK